MGYLCRISILGYVLKSYPDYQKISLHILSYPIISLHILSYPIISSGANSQMVEAMNLTSTIVHSASCCASELDTVDLRCNYLMGTQVKSPFTRLLAPTSLGNDCTWTVDMGLSTDYDTVATTGENDALTNNN